MRLKYYGLSLLVARGGTLADNHITYLIALPLQLVLLGEVNQKLNDALLLLRGAGYFGNGLKLLPYLTGL